MSLSIRGIGTALPATSITQDEALQLARVMCSRTEEQETWLPSMFTGTGIRQRRLVHSETLVHDIIEGTRRSSSPFQPTGEAEDCGPSTATRMKIYAEEAAPLAHQAAAQALQCSGVQPETISHLITVSCTGFAAPGVDLSLIQTLPLRPTTERTHLGFMGCHGALNGLRVANAFAKADAKARVLLCAVELCSLHYHYGWDPQKIIANALFADGAAALVGIASADEQDWEVDATGSCCLPDSEDAMSWTIGEHGFEMTLSRRVRLVIEDKLRPWMQTWLQAQNLTIEDVATWAVHPGGPRILDAVEKGLQLTPDALHYSREVLEDFGNLSSPTLLFILQRLQRQNAPRPCVMLGFGPGLVAEAVLLR